MSLRRLYGEDLHNLYSSPDRVIRSKIRGAGLVERIADIEKFKIHAGNDEGTRSPERFRHRSKYNIKMHL
jgi:hypothetical protein